MYSFHSSPEEKSKLLYALAQHGIETTVDRVAKKKRIRDWIQESVIQEEEEEEESEPVTPASLITRAPVAGHVSSVRAAERASKKLIVSTIKDAAKKHMDPRTGRVQQGPSEMGAYTTNKSNGIEAPHTNGVHKLVDVGSQTSSDAQNNVEHSPDEQPGDTAQTNHMPFESRRHLSANRRQNSAPEPLSTSRGLMAAFNSVATITVPESQRNHALIQQDVLKNNKQVNDSGYGSLDKLKVGEHNPPMMPSPVMGKRMNLHASYPNGRSHGRNGHHRQDNGFDRYRNKEHSPFESDSGGEGSPSGSSGFMNRSTIITSTMKDTPYDHIKPRRNKIK